MKKLLLLIPALSLLISCNNKDAYSVDVTVPVSVEDNSVVYLQKLDSNWKDLVTVDSAIVKNGEFTFKGSETFPVLAYIQIGNIEYTKEFIIEPGKISIVYGDSSTVVSGTASNDLHEAFTSRMMSFEKELSKLKGQIANSKNDPEKATLEKEINSKFDAFNAEIKTYVKDAKGTQAGILYLLRSSYLFDNDELKSLAEAIPVEYKSNERIISFIKHVEAVENTSVGKTFTDVKGKNEKGEEVALADYAGKGKIVLIDFWASWCPPCRRDMPEVVELYKKYKNKDFEIVGITLDNEVEKWTKGMTDLKVTWPQMSDLKGWKSELSSVYGVNSIPHTVLIDKDGTIIARGLSVEELKTKLAELIK